MRKNQPKVRDEGQGTRGLREALHLSLAPRSSLLVLVIALVLGCLSPRALPAIEIPTGHPEIRLFFNQPPGDGGTEEEAVKLIDSAKTDLFMAYFEIGREKILAALVRAAERLGADKVRIVTERRYVRGKKLRSYYQSLENAGITVEYDGKRRNPGQGLMHNKFIVVDNEMIWTGSMNFTKNNMLEDDNNILILRSPEMAAAYRQEFEEMYVDGQFGGRKLDNTRKDFLVAGVPMELRFSPSDNVNERIVRSIENAKKTIHFCIFTFTAENISRALIAAHGRGVTVEGMFDDRSAGSRHSAWNDLKERNFHVKKDGHRSILHHKFMVIDGETEQALVITGSHNWTRGADRKNDENTLFIKDGVIARAYLAEFRRVFHGESAPAKVSEDDAEESADVEETVDPVADEGGDDPADAAAAADDEPDTAEAGAEPEVSAPAREPAPAPPARREVAPAEKARDKPSEKKVKPVRPSVPTRSASRPAPPVSGAAPRNSMRSQLEQTLPEADQRVDEELAAYIQLKRQYDGMGWLDFARRDAVWREMNQRYHEYNALRMYRNRLVELIRQPPDDLPGLCQQIQTDLEETELRRRRLEKSGDEDDARLAALRCRELELLLPVLESMKP